MTDDVVDVIAREVVDRTAILFKAIKPKGGEMPVVMGSGGSGILLHEAIGHAFEADFNRKDISIFSSQLNKKVCNEHINVVDDENLYCPGRCTYQLSARSYQRQALWCESYGKRPSRYIPQSAYPPHARHVYGSRKYEGSGYYFDCKERYFRRYVYEWSGAEVMVRKHWQT